MVSNRRIFDIKSTGPELFNMGIEAHIFPISNVGKLGYSKNWLIHNKLHQFCYVIPIWGKNWYHCGIYFAELVLVRLEMSKSLIIGFS